MSKKRKNIKIKHHNYNLYHRKKSRGKQVLAVIVTIVAAAALCVVGYGVGKPVLNYFQNKEDFTSDSSSGWTPPATEEITAEATTEIVETVEADEPENYVLSGTFILPESAALSSSSLNSAIAAAKNNGYTSVAVTMKDTDGYFLYKSNIDGIKDSDGIKGALTAEQICDIITNAGLTPVARINTLLDHISSNYIENIKYTSTDGWTWYDNYVDSGGKTWLTPFSSATADFIGSITSELSDAGFRSIVLTNTIFPAFNSVDYTMLADIGDSEKRTEALWTVIDAAVSGAEGGAEILLEMGEENMFATDMLSTDAEPTADRTKLKSVTLLIDYTADTSSGNLYIDAKSFIGKMSAMYPGQEYAVLIKGNGFSESTLSEVKRAFEETDIVVFSE